MIAVEILVPLSAFAMVFGIAYLWITARHRERMAMIERGLDASIFGQRPDGKFKFLKWGFLCVGVGAGVVAGSILHGLFDMDEAAAIFSMVFLCGGMGMLYFYKK